MKPAQEWRTDRLQRQQRKRLALEILFVILGAVALAMLLSMLQGCAQQEVRTEVCQIHALGVTESGDAMVLSACMSPEAYRAAK